MNHYSHLKNSIPLFLSLLIIGTSTLCWSGEEKNPSNFNGYIIKLKNPKKNLSELKSLKSFGTIQPAVITSFGTFAVLKSTQKLNFSTLKGLSLNENIEYIEPNFLIHLKWTPQIHSSAVSLNEYRNTKKNNIPMIDLFNRREDSLPKDPYFSDQWGLWNQNDRSSFQSSQNISADLNIVEGWKISRGNSDNPIKIGIIDTGIDYEHSDLQEQVYTNLMELQGAPNVDDDNNGFIDDIHGYDFVNNDGDPMDDGGHGTHCAGVIGARHNDLGIAGVIPNVKLVGLKFLDRMGDGQEIDAIKAIDYAIKNGIRVLSNSWGGDEEFKPLAEAIEAANKAGIVFLAAAGNDGINNDTHPSFPANFNHANLISVGSFDSRGRRSQFSNYGIQKVHVFAPGTDILSTYPRDQYEVLSGTSMATPHVAGVVGLILSNWPDLTPEQVRDHLIRTSFKTKALEDDSVSQGRVDVSQALSTSPL